MLADVICIQHVTTLFTQPVPSGFAILFWWVFFLVFFPDPQYGTCGGLAAGLGLILDGGVSRPHFPQCFCLLR